MEIVTTLNLRWLRAQLEEVLFKLDNHETTEARRLLLTVRTSVRIAQELRESGPTLGVLP